MLVSACRLQTDNIPKPVWRYPVQYIAYHTYSLNGLMSNEFLQTRGWDCPCSIQPGGCPNPACSLDGREVRTPAAPCASCGLGQPENAAAAIRLRGTPS